MVGRVFAAAAAVLIVACSPALADPMTIDFSWQGAKGCITLFPNPEIRLRNVPPGAKLLLLTLDAGHAGNGWPGNSTSREWHFAAWSNSNLCSLSSRHLPLDGCGKISNWKSPGRGSRGALLPDR